MEEQLIRIIARTCDLFTYIYSPTLLLLESKKEGNKTKSLIVNLYSAGYNQKPF